MDKMSAITIYRSVIPTFGELPPEDFKTLVLAYWHYAFDGEEPTGLSIYQKALFESLRANIDASNKRRVEAAERKKESREKRKAKLEESISSQSQNVTTCHKMSQDVTECHKMSQDVTVTSQDVTTCHKMSRTNVNVDVDVNENVNENVNVDENVNENVDVNVKEDVNVNVDNKESGEILSPQPSKKKFVKPTVEEVRNYCIERKNNINAENFVDFYESKNWYVGKNKMVDWKAAVRTWERRNSSNSYTNRVDVVDSWLTGGAND